MSNDYRKTEDHETTRVEKLLTFGLDLFLLIGLLWVSYRIEELIPVPVPSSVEMRIEDELGIPAVRAQSDRQGKTDHFLVWEEIRRARAFNDAEGRYIIRREKYLSAIEADRSATSLEAACRQAHAAYVFRWAEYKAAMEADDGALAYLDGLNARPSGSLPAFRFSTRAYMDGLNARLHDLENGAMGVALLREQIRGQETVVRRLGKEADRRYDALGYAGSSYRQLEADRSAPSAYRQARADYVSQKAEWHRAQVSENQAKTSLLEINGRLGGLERRKIEILARRSRAWGNWRLLVFCSFSAVLIVPGWLRWRRVRNARLRYRSLLKAFLIAAKLIIPVIVVILLLLVLLAFLLAYNLH